MRHILGNKVLQYDVDDRGVIVDEREIDRTINLNPNIPDVSIWIKQHMVFWYDVQKQGATNEILKANPYLQDFSGHNRPLKLNNFLFAAMSGVGGYDIASTNILPDRANVTVTDNRIIHITKKLSTTDNMVNIVPANSNPTHKFKITGLSDGRQVSLVNRNGGFYTFDNGEHEVTLTYPEGTTSLYNAIGVTGSAGDMDVTIEWCMEHGIVPPIHARRSVDGTMILLHEDFVAPVLGDEEIPSYLYDSNELSEILNSEVWTEMN